MSTESKRRYLRSIASEPRTLRSFSEGKVHETTSVRHIEADLAEMVKEGLIFAHDDWYHITEAGILANDVPTTKAEPRTWCGAATERNWKPKPWLPVRAGADEHKQHQSLMTWGQGA